MNSVRLSISDFLWYLSSSIVLRLVSLNCLFFNQFEIFLALGIMLAIYFNKSWPLWILSFCFSLVPLTLCGMGLGGCATPLLPSGS